MNAQHGVEAAASELLAGLASITTVGVDLFAQALTDQAVDVVPVDWRPPPSGTATQLAAVLADPRRQAANALALERVLSAGAVLVDVRPASEALDLAPGTFLHAGPPLDFARVSGPMRGALVGAMLLEDLAADPAALQTMGKQARAHAWEAHDRFISGILELTHADGRGRA